MLSVSLRFLRLSLAGLSFFPCAFYSSAIWILPIAYLIIIPAMYMNPDVSSIIHFLTIAYYNNQLIFKTPSLSSRAYKTNPFYFSSSLFFSLDRIPAHEVYYTSTFMLILRLRLNLCHPISNTRSFCETAAYWCTLRERIGPETNHDSENERPSTWK